MAVDMFLKCALLPGESTDKVYAGCIDVLSWSWGVSQSGTMHIADGGGAGKASFQDVSITSWYEKSTHAIMRACAQGTHIPLVELIVRKAGDKPLDYITHKLTDCLISSVSTGGSGGEDRLTVTFAINFAKIESVYKPQSAKGELSDPVNFGYSISENLGL